MPLRAFIQGLAIFFNLAISLISRWSTIRDIFLFSKYVSYLKLSGCPSTSHVITKSWFLFRFFLFDITIVIFSYYQIFVLWLNRSILRWHSWCSVINEKLPNAWWRLWFRFNFRILFLFLVKGSDLHLDFIFLYLFSV